MPQKFLNIFQRHTLKPQIGIGRRIMSTQIRSPETLRDRLPHRPSVGSVAADKIKAE